MFAFRGKVLPSKSWLNRALVIQYFNPGLRLHTESASEDVLALKNAISQIELAHSFDLGMGGTSFRFFSFLISRKPGNWIVKGHSRLMQRPQHEIPAVLSQLGVSSELIEDELHIRSQGWRPKGQIRVGADVSSQFISGLLLSCWGLDFDLEIEIKKPVSSLGYLQMSLALLKSSGLQITIAETSSAITYQIPKNQKVQAMELQSELDVSSAFSLIAAAVVNGQLEITNWNKKSSQPDMDFLEIFKKMNISYEIQNSSFLIKKHSFWKAVECDLNNSPDLFPVLAALCAFADGVSTLSGAAQLRHKESDRIKKTQELLSLIGVHSELLTDGLRIYGKSSVVKPNKILQFSPDHDHRMAMAAALFKLNSYPIEISQPEVVNKSYPDFWKDIGL